MSGCHSASYLVVKSLKYAGMHQKKHSATAIPKAPKIQFLVISMFLIGILTKYSMHIPKTNSAAIKIAKKPTDSANDIAEIDE